METTGYCTVFSWMVWDFLIWDLNGKTHLSKFDLVFFGYQDVDVVKNLTSQLNDAMKMIQSLQRQNSSKSSPATTTGRTSPTPPSSAGKTTTTPSPATSAKTKVVKPGCSVPSPAATPPNNEDKVGSMSWTLLIASILFPQRSRRTHQILNPKLPIKISIP